VRDFAAGHKSQIMSVDVHPTDSQLFLSSSFDGLVLAWDIRQPDAVARFESSASCMHACWNYNGTRVFCARRNESSKFFKLFVL
jgi:WD40 repeat protein